MKLGKCFGKTEIADRREEVPDIWQEETAVGVVEIILILVVLISLVLIFKKQLTALVKGIFIRINSSAADIY
ncbi:Flp1 family type IVb pilin [Fusibacillus kribbianus]|uniref:Flp1 family type IVb pilin n=1 Tax=Fusibacillus kribbianus TaxID=3044208 RepID=A0AAP4F0T4_9FIRM|nr:Flp1 family type IVb pilin [Ruminococcus sp. YH-rum2234]MDI9242428.1 Flp1 family type IVb pilin [Ruminococcus sp. YH-rum2234]